MSQEFVIKSTSLEDKINQLLPSQGGAQAGVDLSASTMIVPIVDLTESAEGSQLRVDLQSSLSLTSITAFAVSNATSTIINTTGYFRIFATTNITNATGNSECHFSITDGTTTKKIISTFMQGTSTKLFNSNVFDFIVKVEAGDSVTATGTTADSFLVGNTRQIADLSGNLVNP